MIEAKAHDVLADGVVVGRIFKAKEAARLAGAADVANS
jgi:hypothetical protein